MMIPNHQNQPNKTTEITDTLSPRTLLHRSILGVVGVGLGTLLVACGDEEDVDDLVPAGNNTEQPGKDENDDPGVDPGL